MKKLLLAIFLLSSLTSFSMDKPAGVMNNYFITVKIEDGYIMLPIKSIEWIEINEYASDTEATVMVDQNNWSSVSTTVKGKENVDDLVRQIKMVNDKVLKYTTNKEESLNGKESI